MTAVVPACFAASQRTSLNLGGGRRPFSVRQTPSTPRVLTHPTYVKLSFVHCLFNSLQLFSLSLEALLLLVHPCTCLLDPQKSDPSLPALSSYFGLAWL